MAFWPDVVAGQKVEHHVLLENSLRHLVNGGSVFSAGAGRGRSATTRLNIYNAGNSPLAAGQAVAFDEGKILLDDFLPAVPPSGDPELPWGICTVPLEPTQTGSCIVSGPAKVNLAAGSEGNYARPVTGGGHFERVESGGARILFCGPPDSTTGLAAAIILLGAAAAPPAAAGYNSYFKLTLSSATSGEGTVHTVTIADGATGGDSLAVVNGYTLYSIAPYTEAVTTDRCFFLKYTPAVYDDSGAVTPATLVIGSGGELPSYLSTGCFYTQLGRVIFTGGVPSVVQDFTAGVADVRWYVKCVN